MLNRFLSFAISLAFAQGEAAACSPDLATIAQLPEQVASRGMIIEGRVVQGFDAFAEKSEIIEADRIFIGEGPPRRFVIAREPIEFEQVRRGMKSTCDYHLSLQDGRSRLFVLFPAPPSSNGNDRPRWVVHVFGSIVTYGDGIKATLNAAARSGRLRGRPVKPSLYGL